MNKPNYSAFLYQTISVAFCVIVLVSNLISAKLVQFPFWVISLPAGLITYPLTFLLSDLVTEFYGLQKARMMIYLSLAMNLLAFLMIEMALLLPSTDTVLSVAFQTTLGLSGLRLFSSLLGYIVSQLVDIQIYAWMKNWTGSRYLWLRNNGSACIAQLVDTAIIDILYLYWGLNMGMDLVFPIMLISYFYKITINIINTPIFYLFIYLINKPAKKQEESQTA